MLPTMHAANPEKIGIECRLQPPAPAAGWLTGGRFALLLGSLVFLAFPAVILGSRTFVFRDFGLFSYPVASFVRESFWRGELPLWNPFSNCGLPFLAQWNTMVLYPPTLLYLLLPLTWSLPFFCLLHVFWGGLGMYFLARHWTGFKLAGGLAGVLFAFNGLTQNFLMWPSHVATFSWLPWVLWLGQEAWRQGGRKLTCGIAAAAMQMLAGGPETILITWLLLLFLVTADACSSRREEAVAKTSNTARRQFLLRFAVMTLLVVLLCAAQLLPFLELLKHSQRDSGYSTLARGWAMPAWGLANLLVPLFRATPNPEGVFFQGQQYWTSSYYCGIGAVWLALVAAVRTRQWRARWLAAAVVLSLWLALGDAGVAYRLLRSIVPAIGIVRYPVKFVIVVSALAPLLAAYGFSALVCQRQRFGRFEWISLAVLLVFVATLVAVGRAMPDGGWPVLWHSGASRAAFLLGEVAFIWLFMRQAAARRMAESKPAITAGLTRSRFWIPVLLGGLLLGSFYLDLLTHVPNQNPTVPPDVYSPGLVRAQFHWQPGPTLGVSRAMVSPAVQDALKYKAISDSANNYLLKRIGLVADCNLLENIPQIHGFFSLTPAEINDVTVAPYVLTNRDFSRLLDFMSVSEITTENFGRLPRATALPWVTAGQQPVFAEDAAVFAAFGQTNIDLARLVFLPLAARGKIAATLQPAARISDARFDIQKVSFTIFTPGPSLAVVSQSYYPDWKAYLDGRPARLWRANYAFQGLEVPTGTHQVLLRYEDNSFRLGAFLSGIGLLALLVLWCREPFRNPGISR